MNLVQLSSISLLVLASEQAIRLDVTTLFSAYIEADIYFLLPGCEE
nr:MAG TPA: hypothetical protein [Crassvirales sp.]